MNKIILTLLLAFFSLTISPQSARPVRESEQPTPVIKQYFSPSEFNQRQKEFITKMAGLDKLEADKFFPVYFELQQKKRNVNSHTRQVVRHIQESNLTEQESAQLIDSISETKINIANLEKEYLDKFKKVLPSGKLLKVLIAEEQFNSELLKEMQRQPF